MMLKKQVPIPGEQPNFVAGNYSSMTVKPGPRVGTFYIEATVVKVTAGQVVLPLVTDIIHPALPIFIKIGSKENYTRLVSEMLTMQSLQDPTNGGSVEYFNNTTGAWLAKVYGANNTVVPAAVTAAGVGVPIKAIFQVPIYLAEYFRKSLDVAESLAWPTKFLDGSTLKDLSIEVPGADNVGAVFSGHKINFWFEADDLAWPVNQPLQIIKRKRFSKPYTVVGDIDIPFLLKDKLLQFSLLLTGNAADRFDKILVKKNGITIREITKSRNDQALYDHSINVAALADNRFDVLFDINDRPDASGLPLDTGDLFEVTATLKTVTGNGQLVVLTESLGQPD